MLGFVLIYFVGKGFYNLALNYGKSKWLFAILGVVSYYAGLLLGGFIIGMIYVLTTASEVEKSMETVLSLAAIPVGVLCCWGFYKILEKQWGKAKLKTNEQVLDSDMIK